MNPVVIRCEGLSGVAIDLSGRDAGIPVGMYLRDYDPEAMDGYGLATWTADPAGAMVFRDQYAAMAVIYGQPVTRPVRDDGLPNRPLRAFNLLVLDVSELAGRRVT